MKYADEYRDPHLAAALVHKVTQLTTGRGVRLMEVCGTHTVAIFRGGIRELLGPNVQLLSGPGCPVCVTSQYDVDVAVALASQPGVTLATYGDMVRVPGTSSSLQQARANGADVRVVYSALDALRLAEKVPDRRVVFLGVGFETTAPTVAVALKEARRRGVANFCVLCLHKLVPPALRALLNSGDIELDGLILPGHVSAVIGVEPYRFLAEEYGLPAVVTGFEPSDILSGVCRLVEMTVDHYAALDCDYRRAVRVEGNPVAVRTMWEVFQPSEALWRGLGMIPSSGLRIREEFAAHDAGRLFALDIPVSREPAGCLCGEVLTGRATPRECRLFARTCTPLQPVGPCMVSSEGVCAAYYAYARD